MTTKWVVLVPGIMGSELRDAGDDRVWPPSPFDVIGSDFGHIDALMGDDLTATSIIDQVTIFKPVYKSLLEDLDYIGYKVGHPDRRLVPFPYDWRRSNSVSASRLADRLDAEFTIHQPDEITLLAHSMGGLVVRRILETQDFTGRTWFPHVRRFISLGTPHFGAAEALEQLTGRRKKVGVAGKDIVKLASDPRFSSIYELAGPPGPNLTSSPMGAGHIPVPVDRFDAGIATVLDLKQANIDAANLFWNHLDLGKRPKDIDYFFFGGAAHTTIARTDFDGASTTPVEWQSAGDGTVPISSSLARGIAHGFSRKEHGRIFEDREVRKLLYVFLDADPALTPQSADGQPATPGANALGLSVDKEAYVLGEPIQVVGSFLEPESNPLLSFGFLRQVEDVDPRPTDHDHHVVVTIEDGSVSDFVVTLHVDLVPGVYLLLSNQPSDDPQPTTFIVMSADV